MERPRVIVLTVHKKKRKKEKSYLTGVALADRDRWRESG
jgi:hypothetical protein